MNLNGMITHSNEYTGFGSGLFNWEGDGVGYGFAWSNGDGIGIPVYLINSRDCGDCTGDGFSKYHYCNGKKFGDGDGIGWFFFNIQLEF